MSNKLCKFSIDPEGFISFQELIINGKKPTSRCGSAMAVSSEGQLYLVGGVDYKCYLSDIWIIDTKDEKLEWKLVEV